MRAHKDKKFDELKDKVRNIRNAKNNRDFTKLLSGFLYSLLLITFLQNLTSLSRFMINPRLFLLAKILKIPASTSDVLLK